MTLYELIKNDPLSLKVFTKAELEIIKKQLLGINLSQSEKNRLSRDIRPKFKFIKRCSVFKEEFEIKKGNEIFKQIEILKNNILLDKIGNYVKKIYLFGSFIQKNMSNKSDIDIAIEFQDIDIKEISQFKKRILIEKHEIFDISIFNNLPDEIKNEVKNNGKIIYENKRKN